MTFAVVFAPEAVEQLVALRRYLDAAAAPTIADEYVDAIVDHCQGLGVFPYGGAARDDLRPGLRTSNFKKRVVIAYAPDEERKAVVVLGIFYGGQDYESLLGR